MFRTLSTFFFLLWISHVQGALPPKVQDYLNKTPEKKLTLPLVVKTAIQKSSAFRLLSYDYSTIGMEEQFKFDSITDTILVAGTRYEDEGLSKPNPFQPLRTRDWQWNLGLEKNWETGTKTSLSWRQNVNQMDFSNRLGRFGDTFLNNFKQSLVNLQIEQDLLRNVFGYSFRQKRQGARGRAKAMELKVRNDIEDLTLVFVEDFYRSWLLQKQVTSLSDQAKRQRRWVRVLTRRSRKRILEEPDIIRVKALLTSTEARMEIAKAELATQWEKLVINLQLPDTFFKVDAMEVPTKIDDPVGLGLKACDLEEPRKTALIQSIEKTLVALDSDFKASKNESLPDLKLIAGYSGNSLEEDSFKNFQNILRGENENGFGRGSSWNVGVRLSWPLNNSGARSKRTTQYIEREKASTQLMLEVDNLKSLWRDQCRKLKVEVHNKELYEQIVLQQKKEWWQKKDAFL